VVVVACDGKPLLPGEPPSASGGLCAFRLDAAAAQLTPIGFRPAMSTRLLHLAAEAAPASLRLGRRLGCSPAKYFTYAPLGTARLLWGLVRVKGEG